MDRKTDLALKLRVLIVTNEYPTKETPGHFPCLVDQITSLEALGIQVELLHIDRSQGRISYVHAAWRLFLTSFQRRRYDLVHGYYGHSGLLARLQFRYPVIVTFRGSDLLSRRDGIIGKLVAKLVDGVIVMSEEMACVAKREDAQVIPFGVNLDLFKPYPKTLARSELGLSLSDKLVLFPWNPARRVKRFDIVKKSVQILQENDQKVSLKVIFNEPPEIVAKYMNACDALVLASDYEGSPMAIREAMACNLPIVSVNVGDVEQIFGDTEGCYLCKQNATDLAEKLAMALSRNQRTTGFETAKKMNAKGAAEKVLSVYQRVVKKHKGRYQKARC
jgi:glycosyltransferase involved in cell wall biosynthesis